MRFPGALQSPALALQRSATVVGTAWAEPFATQRVVAGMSRPVFLTAPPGDSQPSLHPRTACGPDPSSSTSQTDTLPPRPLPRHRRHLYRQRAGPARSGPSIPEYASNGFFYVYITDPDTQVLRYRVSSDPNVASPVPKAGDLLLPILRVITTAGGSDFGPDGLLYIATGDGGWRNDTSTGSHPGDRQRPRTSRTISWARSCASTSMETIFPRTTRATTRSPPTTPSSIRWATTRSGPSAYETRGGRASTGTTG